MIMGMSGYGQVGFSSGKTNGSLEIKSLNHRYLEIICHIPEGLGFLEENLKRIIQNKLRRGRIMLNISLEKPEAKIEIQKKIIQKYLAELRTLEKKLKLKESISLVQIINLPGTLNLREVKLKPQQLKQDVERSLKKALSKLIAMRTQEGKSIHKDVLEMLRIVQKTINLIPERYATLTEEKRQLLATDEFVTFLKSSDVNEEVKRIQFHLANFRRSLNSFEAIGKELDFISQELLRELNTIGAKLLDEVVSSAVIKMKAQVEKMREQLQNIE